MKPTRSLSSASSATAASGFHAGLATLITLALALAPALPLAAADATWTGGSAGTGTQFRLASNWDLNLIPVETDTAYFGAAGTAGPAANPITINMSTAGGLAKVGCITVLPTDTVNRTIANNAGGVNGVLAVYGIGGVLLSNVSAKSLNFDQQPPTSSGRFLGLGLGASGIIHADGPIYCYWNLSEVGGAYGFTKTGTNTLFLYTNSTYSGATTIAQGAVNLLRSGATFGSGPIYLAGGNIICGADRSGVAPITNPVVLSADAKIYSDTGLTGVGRYMVFSGDLSGSAGKLTIRNQGTAGNTFYVRLTGGITFPRDLAVGSSGDMPNIAALQLYNAASAGVQTFSGTISGAGRLERLGADGTTILTGANTYSGGTVIGYGTLLANNTTGSALGSGAVTVTNLGVLGGNGIVGTGVLGTTVSDGGTLSPGTSATDIANLTILDLMLSDGGVYKCQLKAASTAGTAGVDWDLLTVNNGWYDGVATTPFTIKVDSLGTTPTGWNSAVAQDWLIIQGYTPGIIATHFVVDTTAFKGNVAGIFSLSADYQGLHLVYTPASDLVINVPSGSQNQATAGYPYISGGQGVVKVGNGELVLDYSGNDYQGSTKVLAGTLSLGVDALNGSGALGGSTTATYVGNTTGNSNATLNISADNVHMERSIVVQSGSTGTKTIGTTMSTGTATFSGGITLQGSATLSAAGSSLAQFSGAISGEGGLTLAGSGTLTLSGLGSYAGPTLLTAHAVNLNNAALGTNTLTIASPTTLDNTDGLNVTLNACPQNWNADFAFAGTANLNLGAGPVTLNGSRTLTVAINTLTVGGPIAGNGGLTKLGDGTLALTGPASSYTGGTTNLAGVLSLNGTATFGDGTGTLKLAGGQLFCSANHDATALANPVVISTDSLIYGTPMGTAPSGVYLPFSGPFTVGSAVLKIGNTGRSNNTFAVRLQGPNQSNVNWPIQVGDAAFDTLGAISQLDLFNDNTTPTQFVSGHISGVGVVRRGAATPNTGGTSIFTALSTFSGGAQLTSGSIGFGLNSVSSGGTITAGPIGTGLFTIGNQTTSETNMGVFAYGGARVIENPIYLNGAQNIIVSGTNDLTFTGNINAGGIPKTWTVVNTGLTTLAGQITSSGTDGAALTKAGSGTLVLSGDNRYTGTTTIRAGTLLANSPVGSGTSSNTVYVQAAGTLGGTGTVAGRVSVTSGTVAPGQGVGTLTLAGGLNLSSGGTYLWDLAANSTSGAGSTFDVLAVTGGSVVLDGTCKLAINFTGSATAPDAANPFWQTAHSWTILTVSGSASNPGPTTFASVANGTYAAGSFTTAADASGNIILTYTPTPQQPVISGDISGAGTPNPTIAWSAVNSLIYQVEYKTNLNQANWVVLGRTNAVGSVASFTHTNCLFPQCFYRVVIP